QNVDVIQNAINDYVLPGEGKADKTAAVDGSWKQLGEVLDQWGQSTDLDTIVGEAQSLQEASQALSDQALSVSALIDQHIGAADNTGLTKARNDAQSAFDAIDKTYQSSL